MSLLSKRYPRVVRERASPGDRTARSKRRRAAGRWRRAGFLVLPVLGAGAACARRPPPPNVLLIVIDSLRPDALGCYGAGGGKTPTIDRLAEEGTLFEDAVAPSPWTLPSVATILTGRTPLSHGAIQPERPVPRTVPTIAEAFARAGYETGAVVSHVFLQRDYGLHRGFAYFSDRPIAAHEVDPYNHDSISSPAVNEDVEAFLSRPRKGPFFLFLHYFDPHYNYLRHPEGKREHADLQALQYVRDPLDENALAALRRAYDGEIRFTDAHLGILLDRLSSLRLLDDTLVALTADHGEAFQEHGWLGHTKTLHEEMVRVPLVVRFRGRVEPKRRVRDSVRLEDLAPTILELAGLAPLAGAEGRSLVPLMRGERLPPAPAALTTFLDADLVGVRADGWKLVRDRRSGTETLHDLRADPGERENLVEVETTRASTLRLAVEAAIERAWEADLDPEKARIDPKILETLREMGYGGR